MIKTTISNLLRTLGLLFITDRVRYFQQKFKNRKINHAFKSANPSIALPPDYLIYESYQLNFAKYFTDGRNTAQWLANHFSKHITLENLNILDWGCGPGRVIRHMPDVIGNNCRYFGTDYNPNSIEWCSKNLPGIEFNLNGLSAQLPYPDQSMDVIFGISIFTHLSEPLHQDWYTELYRILKPNGILFLTTQGDNFKVKLSPNELNTYNQQKLVIRGNVKEGHRTYSAFQPPAFMHRLFSNATILEHIETRPESGQSIPQDIWIVRK